jgi:hypothetical protein
MFIVDTEAGQFLVAGPAFPNDPANAHVMRTGTDYPYRERAMIDIAELTKRFGRPDHEQSAVAAWTGDPYGTTWDKEEADQLHQAWEVDQFRIGNEKG